MIYHTVNNVARADGHRLLVRRNGPGRYKAVILTDAVVRIQGPEGDSVLKALELLLETTATILGGGMPWMEMGRLRWRGDAWVCGRCVGCHGHHGGDHGDRSVNDDGGRAVAAGGRRESRRMRRAHWSYKWMLQGRRCSVVHRKRKRQRADVSSVP